MEGRRQAEKNRLLKRLEEQFPGGVPRSKVKEATGGLVSPKTMANLASQNDQPEGWYRVRGRIVYPAESFVDWLYADDNNGGEA